MIYLGIYTFYSSINTACQSFSKKISKVEPSFKFHAQHHLSSISIIPFSARLSNVIILVYSIFLTRVFWESVFILLHHIPIFYSRSLIVSTNDNLLGSVLLTHPPHFRRTSDLVMLSRDTV